MSSKPLVLKHAYKHGLRKRDIVHAWENAYASQMRVGTHPPQRLAVGADLRGRDIQTVSVWNDEKARWVIIHAMPVTQNVLRELGMIGGRR